MSDRPTISDLGRKPEFFDTVADRIWRAWWKDRGFPLSYIAGRLAENLTGDPLPIALVAHDGANFLGTSSVIASDLEDLPQYTPWVAAVWVDPAHRARRVGRALVARAADCSFGLGFDRVYLSAPKPRRDFYLRQGWLPIEEDIGTRKVTVFMLERGAVKASNPAARP